MPKILMKDTDETLDINTKDKEGNSPILIGSKKN